MESQPTKPMLHELIRFGAALHPQGLGRYYEIIAGIPRTCALGAACSAAGLIHEHMYPAYHVVCDIATLMQRYPILQCAVEVEGQSSRTLYSQIIYWNDTDRLTREQIADKVEVLERQSERWVERKRQFAKNMKPVEQLVTA